MRRTQVDVIPEVIGQIHHDGFGGPADYNPLERHVGLISRCSVIEQQTYLAQAETTVVMAKAAWLKAAAQLDRVLGQTLEKNGISLKADQGEIGAPQR